MRELFIEYAQQVDDMSDHLMQEVVCWHQRKAANVEFKKTFPHIVCLGQPVARDLTSASDLHPWLTAHAGSGGYWTYNTTRRFREVTIPPIQRSWDWAQYRDCFGFRQASHAMLFKLTYVGR
jgi:hypothetical protein